MVRASGEDRSYREKDPIRRRKKKACGKVTFEFCIFHFLCFHKADDVESLVSKRVNRLGAFG